MYYNIQSKLNDVLGNLQLNVNQGNLNPTQKEEAIKIITKIRIDYKDEIEQYHHKKQSIENIYIDKNFITDQSFMIEYVSTKKNLDELRLSLLYLHKSTIIDDHIRWEDRFLQLVEVFFNRKGNEFSKNDFFSDLIYYRSKNVEYISECNININYILKEQAFYTFIKDQIIKEPKLIGELLINNILPEFDADNKFDIKNDLLIELSIYDFEILKYIPEKFKEHFLINLLSINENILAREYLHPIYKNNKGFCKLFESHT